MNELIKELADKAIDDMPGAWNIPDEFCKKFAELIVRECAVIFKQNWTMAGSEPPISAVKQHFGVEE